MSTGHGACCCTSAWLGERRSIPLEPAAAAAAHYDQLRPLAVLKQRHDRAAPPHEAGNLDVREFLLPAGPPLGQGPARGPPPRGRAEGERMGPHPTVEEYLAPRVHRRQRRVSRRGLF